MSSVPRERRGLGRGLEVLLGEAGQPELVHLPVETIHPNPRQPRRRFEPEAASGLASSIRLQGVLQPIVVGFGCNVPAVSATRILPNARHRVLTALLVPFTSCSARLTVYVLLATTFFPAHAGTVDGHV